MSEIADLTNDPMAFTEIMVMLWKRLNDHGKNWRHVYKSLVLLDYLIKCGNEKVAQQCRENIYSIETLKDFQHIEDNRDQGLNVREKAKQMVALLNDEERLKNERARYQMTRKRFIANGTGISSDGSSRVRRGESSVIDAELEEARPSSIGEEEMQLQIALALSREENAKEEEMRRGDDVRLQIALEESKRNASTNGDDAFGDEFVASAPSSHKIPTNNEPKRTGLESALEDLMQLNLCDPAPTSINAPTLNDPWGTPSTGFNNDTWGALPPPKPTTAPTTVYPDLFTAPASNDPWAAASIPAVPSTPASNDPWLPGPPTQLPPTNTKVNDDPWAISFAPAEPKLANNDPWAVSTTTNAPMIAEPLNQSPVFDSSKQTNGARSNSKTPESFLGESSSLVNFDNLMGPPPSSLPPRPGSNPFGAPSAVSSTNPFAVNRAPAPSINELMMSRPQGRY
uniref:ENTH domain-containing protein n=1 Tax=Panagrolaimus superbus TaxID=310955 RepID=A0A914Y2V4_9BILA